MTLITHLPLIGDFILEPPRQVEGDGRDEHHQRLRHPVVDPARHGRVDRHLHVPVDGHGHRHVDGRRHERVRRREEERDEGRVHVLRVEVRPVGEREQQEGAEEEEDVEGGQGAEHVDKVAPQLDVLVPQHHDAEHVAQDAKEADEGHEKRLHHVLERHLVQQSQK